MEKNALENIILTKSQKVYFASDFHLGAPDLQQSHERERKIISWINSIKHDAAAIFLMGDVFDFWFEYKQVVPKGFIRTLGKLAELRESGIPIFIFTGNHDMWMRDYFEKELGIPVFRKAQSFKINELTVHLGHGDGLGPGDYTYKMLKVVFESRISRWMFRWLHPDIGVAIAKAWSGRSRITNIKKGEDHFKGEENEWLVGYCKSVEKQQHHDFYIFGHRHLPLNLPVEEGSHYINLGEWVNYNSYAVCDGETCQLLYFDATKSVSGASLNT